MERFIGVEILKNQENTVLSAEMLGATRLLIENVRIYGDHLVTTEAGPYILGAYDEALKEFIERFYELAAPQLPEWLIDKRLGIHDEEADLNDLLAAVDTELQAWQRGGLVTSQVTLLEEFTSWLYVQHTSAAMEAIEDEAVQRMLSRNTSRVRSVLDRLKP